MEYLVTVETVEPRPMAAVRRQTTGERLSVVIPESCGVVWRFIKEFGVPHLGINVCVYFDHIMNLECGVLVNADFDPSGEVVRSATPGGLVATTMHLGPYSKLGDAHQAIIGWSKMSGHALAGPSWEIYDHWNDDESKLRTDIYYLLKATTADDHG